MRRFTKTEIMNSLQKAVEEIDLNTIELANAICDIIAEDYGTHNFANFKEVVNKRLSEPKKELSIEEEREAKLEALYEKHGNLKSKAIKVDYKIRVAETQINILEAEMGISKPFYK